MRLARAVRAICLAERERECVAEYGERVCYWWWERGEWGRRRGRVGSYDGGWEEEEEEGVGEGGGGLGGGVGGGDVGGVEGGEGEEVLRRGGWGVL